MRKTQHIYGFTGGKKHHQLALKETETKRFLISLEKPI